MTEFINQFHLYIIVFARITALIVIVPVFGSRVISVQLKIALSALLTLLVTPLLPAQHIPVPENLIVMFMLIGREVVAGLVIGFATTLIFMAFQYAGTMVGMQMGFGIVNVVDPQSNLQVSIMAQYLYIVATLIFLSIDGHFFLIQALVHSFKVIPVTEAIFTGKIIEKILSMSAQVFVLAVKIGVPAIISLLLTSVALGVIARTVPQMNVFIIGFPLNIGLGLLTVAASFPLMLYLFQKLYKIYQQDILMIIKILAG